MKGRKCDGGGSRFKLKLELTKRNAIRKLDGL